MSNEEIKTTMSRLSDLMKEDYGYAWSWHCNIAMSHLDAMARAGYKIGNVEREAANQGAARFMYNAFGVNTDHKPR